MSSFSGVYPVYNTTFKIGTKGKTSASEDMKTIADMESFSIIYRWNSRIMDTNDN